MCILFGFMLSQYFDRIQPSVVVKQHKRLNFAKSITEILSPAWSQVVSVYTFKA